MKTAGIIALSASLTGLCAQDPQPEAGIWEARISVFGEMVKPRDFTLSGIPPVRSLSPKSQTGLGIRFMGQLVKESRWYYDLAYRPDVNVRTDLTFENGVSIRNSPVRVEYGWWSAGIAYLLPLDARENLRLGFHLDARADAVKLKIPIFDEMGNIIADNAVSNRSVYFRPWLRVSLDYRFHVKSWTPFVGFDVGCRTLRTRQVTPYYADSRTLRAIAPMNSASIYAGLAF